MKKKHATRDRVCASAQPIDIRRELPAALNALRGYAMRLTKSPQDADDLIQQTAYRALRAEHQFDTRTSLSAWVYVIMRNEFLSRCRLNKKRRTLALEKASDECVARPETQTNAIFVKEVNKIMNKLTGGQAAVLDGVGLGLKYEEIAELLDIPVGSVKSRLWRGRAAVARAVA